MIEKKRKKIDLDKASEVVARFSEVKSPIVTAMQFVKLHFDEIQHSGKSLEDLHHFLLANGIDVGPCNSFRAAYNSVKRGREKQLYEKIESEPREQTSAPKPAAPAKAAAVVPVQAADADKPPGSEAAADKNAPRGQGLRPIRLADGSEVKIHPETGARIFDV